MITAHAVAIVGMVDLLHTEASNIKDIVEKTGLCKPTVIRYIRLLKKRKLIRVVEYRTYGKCYSPIALYEWNPENLPDTPRPKPKTRAEISQKYRDKKFRQSVGLI